MKNEIASEHEYCKQRSAILHVTNKLFAKQSKKNLLVQLEIYVTASIKGKKKKRLSRRGVELKISKSAADRSTRESK